MNKLFLLLLASCSYFHTKASLDETPNVSEAEISKINLTSKGEGKAYTFTNKDLLRVSNAFIKVLQGAGYTITYQDLYSGKLGAESISKDKLAEFNSSFSGNGNYKVSENTVLDLVLIPEKSDVNSEIQIKKVSVYSMGQEEVEPLNDTKLYQEIISKVNLAL